MPKVPRRVGSVGVSTYSIGRETLTKLTKELATQRLANSSFSVLLAALLQISGASDR
jgi:hypothetical protein